LCKNDRKIIAEMTGMRSVQKKHLTNRFFQFNATLPDKQVSFYGLSFSIFLQFAKEKTAIGRFSVKFQFNGDTSSCLSLAI